MELGGMDEGVVEICIEIVGRVVWKYGTAEQMNVLDGTSWNCWREIGGTWIGN